MNEILTKYCTYRLTDSCGWYVVFQSPVQDSVIERIALNAKTGGGATSSGSNTSGTDVMLGIASGPLVRLWAFSTHTEPVRRTLVGKTMLLSVNTLCCVRCRLSEPVVFNIFLNTEPYTYDTL